MKLSEVEICGTYDYQGRTVLVEAISNWDTGDEDGRVLVRNYFEPWRFEKWVSPVALTEDKRKEKTR